MEPFLDEQSGPLCFRFVDDLKLIAMIADAIFYLINSRLSALFLCD